MPDRLPPLDHWPPTRREHMLAHGGLYVASLWWWVLGALLLLPTVLTGWTPSAVLNLLPAWVPTTVGTLLLIGGLMTNWSVITVCPRLDIVWTVQQAGLVLAGGGWVLDAVLLAMHTPESLTVGGAVAHAGIAAVSLIASVKAEHRLRQLVETREEEQP